MKDDKDEVIGMISVKDNSKTVLVVSENGYGKRTFLNDPDDGEPIYRITKRGGKGVKTLTITEKTGALIAIKQVQDDDQLMIINKSGIAIRMDVSEMRVMGRATQGVRLINLKGKDEIAAVAKIALEHLENENNVLGEDEEFVDGEIVAKDGVDDRTSDEIEGGQNEEAEDSNDDASEDSGKAFDNDRDED